MDLQIEDYTTITHMFISLCAASATATCMRLQTYLSVYVYIYIYIDRSHSYMYLLNEMPGGTSGIRKQTKNYEHMTCSLLLNLAGILQIHSENQILANMGRYSRWMGISNNCGIFKNSRFLVATDYVQILRPTCGPSWEDLTLKLKMRRPPMMLI